MSYFGYSKIDDTSYATSSNGFSWNVKTYNDAYPWSWVYDADGVDGKVMAISGPSDAMYQCKFFDGAKWGNVTLPIPDASTLYAVWWQQSDLEAFPGRFYILYRTPTGLPSLATKRMWTYIKPDFEWIIDPDQYVIPPTTAYSHRDRFTDKGPLTEWSDFVASSGTVNNIPNDLRGIINADGSFISGGSEAQGVFGVFSQRPAGARSVYCGSWESALYGASVIGESIGPFQYSALTTTTDYKLALPLVVSSSVCLFSVEILNLSKQTLLTNSDIGNVRYKVPSNVTSFQFIVEGGPGCYTGVYEDGGIPTNYYNAGGGGASWVGRVASSDVGLLEIFDDNNAGLAGSVDPIVNYPVNIAGEGGNSCSVDADGVKSLIVGGGGGGGSIGVFRNQGKGGGGGYGGGSSSKGGGPGTLLSVGAGGVAFPPTSAVVNPTDGSSGSGIHGGKGGSPGVISVPPYNVALGTGGGGGGCSGYWCVPYLVEWGFFG